MEMYDIFNLVKDKKYSKLLESIKNTVKLHLIGITSENPEFSSAGKLHKGFATNKEIKKCMESITKKISVYSSSFLTINGTHTFLFLNEKRCIMLREVLDFAYNNRK